MVFAARDQPEGLKVCLRLEARLCFGLARLFGAAYVIAIVYDVSERLLDEAEAAVTTRAMQQGRQGIAISASVVVLAVLGIYAVLFLPLDHETGHMLTARRRP